MMIFFDIDETLIDQRSAERAAVSYLLQSYRSELGGDDSVERFCAEWRALREKHAPAFLAGAISAHEQRRRRVRELLARRDRALPDDAIDRLIGVYEQHYRRAWRLFDDVWPALGLLRQHRCGIISNGSRRQQYAKLRRTGIAPCFDPVLVSEDVGAAKPDREIFLAACGRAGVPPQNCVYVGDRIDHDALPSRAAGMRAFWLCRGSQNFTPGTETVASLVDLAARLDRRSAA